MGALTYALGLADGRNGREIIGFTRSGVWNVDDVLKPIYRQAGDKLGKEFSYPDPTAN